MLYTAFPATTFQTPRPSPAFSRSKAQVCGRSGVAVSNPAGGMGVCPFCLLCCVGSGLSDGPITRPGEPYHCVSLRVTKYNNNPLHLTTGQVVEFRLKE